MNSTAEFLKLLQDIDKSKKISHDEAERIAKTAIFENGQLKSFEYKALHEYLNVTEFSSFLERLGLKAEIGDSNGRPSYPNYKWGGFDVKCIPWTGDSCSE